ncbi:electron transfer flavoprotein regulatory factor 1 [Vanessa atalanta]|uniref:electron transfer flavoprotein regulatory factor 1 n=1 Tax=Vanessa cardui TaxID=171605 RepID=UPI001F138E79|nr:electron transfer flavoprotein regulatory factor 1 [Vanessa cardui]XP_047530390.1 electron transfer flavoprotein regulatory factor 1 [Vanessa atalanta]
MSQPQRRAVLNLYKTLLFLGRDWPQGYELFRKRLHNVFLRNSEETDSKKIDMMLKHGQFVVKEIEALYKLKKYRAMKRRYYDDN